MSPYGPQKYFKNKILIVSFGFFVKECDNFSICLINFQWGAFNREQTCRTSLSAFNWGHSMGRGHRFGGSGSGGGNQQDACCGQEGEK